MRFMILRMADAETEAMVMPSEQLLRDMGNYMEEMHKAGVLISGDGLHPSSKATRIEFKKGKPILTDGPFTEAKELIAGFSMIDVKSKEEALEWVKRWPALDGGGNVRLELRQVFEAEDFGEEFTPELRAREDRLRAELAQKQG